MKNLKPLQLVFSGSFFVGLLTLILMLIFRIFGAQIDTILYFLIPIVTGGICFVVFYFLIKRFINDRLKLLYRSIRKGKLTKEDKMKQRLSDDPISVAEIETRRWSDEKQNEIVKLRDQEEFRREFLGNLAHELKTPIFSIQGYLLTLLEGGLEDEKVNRMFLERASKATDRMVSLIDDLDQITKLEVDRLKLNIKPFIINDLVADVFESFEFRAKEKNIKLRFDKSYDPIKVLGDRKKISQVLTNLIGNSIAYGNENGETKVRFYSLDDYINIEVSDNGPGIDDESLPRLFERFFRVEKSRNRNDGGSGLGLSIVKHIIESHNQSISVRSTVGVGSTFVFTLDKAK